MTCTGMEPVMKITLTTTSHWSTALILNNHNFSIYNQQRKYICLKICDVDFNLMLIINKNTMECGADLHLLTTGSHFSTTTILLLLFNCNLFKSIITAKMLYFKPPTKQSLSSARYQTN